MERLSIARVLLTIVTIGYGIATAKGDLNKTRATNLLWTARSSMSSGRSRAALGFGVMVQKLRRNFCRADQRPAQI
jgi:hypothetical protein